MSDCIITITIGDQVITLDPGADIVANSITPLASTISTDNLRALYGQLKDNLTLDSVLTEHQQEFIDAGENAYQEFVDNAPLDSFPTILQAIRTEKDPIKLKNLVAYASSLDPKLTIPGDNYLIDPSLTYRASNYSAADIKNLAFKKDGPKAQLFDTIMQLPGMNTLKMSIAYAPKWKDEPLTKVKGAYITPDNIIQVVIPAMKAGYQKIDDNLNKVTSKNLESDGRRELQNVILHEMMHAVFTEAYRSDPSFKNQMDALHGAFIQKIRDDQPMLERYLNVQEFIAAAFEDVKIQNALAKIPSGIDANLNLFQEFTSLVPAKSLANNTLLKDFIVATGTKLTALSADNFFTAPIMNLMAEDSENIFFDPGLDAYDDDENMSTRDQTDTRHGVNRKAFYVNSRFQDKWEREFTDENGKPTGKKDTFRRDSFYKATVSEPSDAHKDRLLQDDIVIMPWLRYIPAQRDAKGNPKTKGRWQEVGYVVDKEGRLLKKNGKPRIEDIIRKDGKIQPSTDGHILKEMTQAFPVVFSNIDKKYVTVAKTTLQKIDELNTIGNKDPKLNKYNTVSYPYELVKGIRQLDRSHFDHNVDYNAELKEAEAGLKKANAISDKQGGDKKFSDTKFFTDRIERLTGADGKEGLIAKAERIKQEMIDVNKKYGWSHKDGDNIIMNVTKEAYEKSGYTTKDMAKRVFPSNDDAVFVIQKSKYKSKDNKETSFSYPNPRMFDLFWGDAEMSKDFLRSAEWADAITAGDLVQVTRPKDIKISSTETRKVKIGEWLTVYKRVANGLMVATENGKGYIVPFNMVTGYAKNRTTQDYAIMLAQYMTQTHAFNQGFYVAKPDGKRGISKEIKSRRMQFSEKFNYDEDKDDDVNAAVTRFDKNLDYVKSIIKPNESFVRVEKVFTNDAGKRIPYAVNALVLAKSNDGLLTFSETRGSVGIEYIKYSDRITPDKPYASEISYLMESMKKVREKWDQFEGERDQYAKNRKTANFGVDATTGNNILLHDPKMNPHGFNDAYDFYDDVNGKTLERLSKSEEGIISIKLNKSRLTDEELKRLGNKDDYERKVIRVLDNGDVIVADYNKTDKTLPNGFEIKAGTVYPRVVKREEITRIGYKLGEVTKDTESGEVTSQYNQDLIGRRKWLFDRAQSDRDYHKLSFARNMASVVAMNNKPMDTERDYWRYVPLTNILLDPLTAEQIKQGVKETRTEQYLDRDLKPVKSVAEAAHVIATFRKGTSDMAYVNRGIYVGTTMIYQSIATTKDANGKITGFKKALTDQLYAGDWVTTKSKGRDWDAIIERIENGKIYTMNTDLTTSWVNPAKIVGIRLSKRNDRFSNFTRADNLLKKLRQSDAANTAVEESRKAKKRQRPESKVDPEEDKPPFSLEAAYKSPKSSTRALREVGNRLQALNPDIQINYVNTQEISNLASEIGHDYSHARAFVLKGTVNINTDKASVGDVLHEYAHLFLHGLKYSNPDLYNAVINVTNNHSLYSKIAADYPHLNVEDLNEEVFVTVLGEYLNNNLRSVDKENMDTNKGSILQFANYAKQTLTNAFNKTGENIYDLDPTKVLQMTWEDVINLVGDHLMNNKITDVYQGYSLTKTSNLKSIINDLNKYGLLKTSC